MPHVPHIASVRGRHYGDITIRTDLVREEYEFFAKKARISERYDDVLKIVLKIIELGWLPLTSSERGLFFSGAIGVYRRLYKDYKSICDNGEDVDGAIFWQYRTAVESEVRELCIDMIKVIVDTLLPTATTEREVADYLRMKGIFHNSLCHLDYIAGDDTFISAQRLSEDLDAVDRTRLATARAYSLFTYYMSRDRNAAVEIATHALRNARDVLDARNEEVPYESASVTRQLENSINLWNANEHFDDKALDRGAAPAA